MALQVLPTCFNLVGSQRQKRARWRRSSGAQDDLLPVLHRGLHRGCTMGRHRGEAPWGGTAGRHRGCTVGCTVGRLHREEACGLREGRKIGWGQEGWKKLHIETEVELEDNLV